MPNIILKPRGVEILFHPNIQLKDSKDDTTNTRTEPLDVLPNPKRSASNI